MSLDELSYPIFAVDAWRKSYRKFNTVDDWRESYHTKTPEVLTLESDPQFSWHGYPKSYLTHNLKQWRTFVIRNEFDLFRLKTEWAPAKLQIQVTSEMFPRHPVRQPTIPYECFKSQLEVLEKLNQLAWHNIFCLKNRIADRSANMNTYVCCQKTCDCKPQRPPKKIFPLQKPRQANGEVDAKEIIVGKAYSWGDWSIVRGQGALYLWLEAIALEFSQSTTEGWFEFILDDELNLCYTSGRSEKRFDCEAFLKEWQKAGREVPLNTTICPVFTKANPDFSITVGKWKLCCKAEGELSIIHFNSFYGGITLKDLSQFVYRGFKGIPTTFKATSVSPEFPAGWTSREALKTKFRAPRRHTFKFSSKDAKKDFLKKNGDGKLFLRIPKL